MRANGLQGFRPPLSHLMQPASMPAFRPRPHMPPRCRLLPQPAIITDHKGKAFGEMPVGPCCIDLTAAFALEGTLCELGFFDDLIANFELDSSQHGSGYTFAGNSSPAFSTGKQQQQGQQLEDQQPSLHQQQSGRQRLRHVGFDPNEHYLDYMMLHRFRGQLMADPGGWTELGEELGNVTTDYYNSPPATAKPDTRIGVFKPWNVDML
ncbi:hypothetical protein COO60DRAFT_692991 [Scenedesmus sp. NREL 46B-D3]|nr:hypothetical protein COO60DRAFT_692991 [Scenedesmus sp. NREL 46B-D3]